MAEPPLLSRRMVEALLGLELGQPRAAGCRLVLVHGRYQTTTTGGSAADTATELRVSAGGHTRRVRISDQQSVLGITDAWQSHLDADPDGDGVLVVTTGVADTELGWDLRAHALGRATRTVDPVQIVAQRFGATDVDPRIRTEPWLVDALLDAEPPGGWRPVGAVLTRDAALRALVDARLGDLAAGGTVDTDALLTWSRHPAAPARFAALPPAERAGLTRWLAETAGPAAPVLLGLAAAGRAGDALALGVVGAVLEPGGSGSADAAFVFGGLLGSTRHGQAELRAFTRAVEGALERWIVQAESAGAGAAEARQRVREVLDRADAIAAEAGLTAALAGNRFLRSALRARLRSLAEALSAALALVAPEDPGGPGRPASAREAVATAEAALCAVRDHNLARLHPEHEQVAGMAVRLLRWLADPTEPVGSVGSVAAGVRAHLADWGWVDRASAALWAGDPTDDPVVARAYRDVFAAVRARREALDRAFAGRLAGWAKTAASVAPGGCLLVEDVLTTVAVPLAGSRAGQAPLVVVLDGMSSAVAVELGEALATRSWTEVTPTPGRRCAAVATVPSVTRTSRASLLTGRFTTGDQQAEKDGFAAFWRRHRRPAVLFHKGEIGGAAGQRLAEPLLAAIGGDGVVGVVLNTIDDALDHGREGGRVGWAPDDIGYLPELLDAALGAGRPVLLVSDHGHVAERGPAGQGPTVVPGAESARWRPADGPPAADGEIGLDGPRVGHGGRVVVPWREDIRYTSRRSGYHGGASLAEMTVPVLVFLPSSATLPAGWAVLPPETTTPPWWERRRTEPAAGVAEPTESAESTVAGPPPARSGRRTGRTRPAQTGEGLFPEPAPAAPPVPAAPPAPVAPPAPPQPPAPSPAAGSSLGARVVASDGYAAQRRFVPRAPDPGSVAAVVDALLAADGLLSLAAVAAVAGRAARSPEAFATTLQRLLNVEGYPVLSVQDGGRALRLDAELLREQFGLAGESR